MSPARRLQDTSRCAPQGAPAVVNQAVTFPGLVRALLAGLAGPGLGLVVQGHLPSASPWAATAALPRSAALPATASVHRVTAAAGAISAGAQP